MIDLHFWPTPNGYKVSILLEELGMPYRIVPVDIGRGDQFKPEFLAISPNNRMPAIVDHAPADGGAPISVFESGAILQYLAEKGGKFLPRDVRGRTVVLEWLAWQIAGLGPMLGQAHHFRQYAPEPIPYAIDRYTKEANRLYGVLDRRLAKHEYLAGEYSIADMASFPWIVPHERQGQSLDEFPNVKRWFDAIAARPAVQRGRDAGKELRRPGGTVDAASRSILFGQTAKLPGT
jgi:GST-like protein